MPSSKKKKEAASEAAVTCVQCSVKIPKQGVIECVCTCVRFCSAECRHKALMPGGKHADCTGAPELQLQSVNKTAQKQFDDLDKDLREKWRAEYNRTVIEPARQRGGIRKAGIDEYIRVADKGRGPANIAAAYLAAIELKKGTAGTPVYGRDGSISIDRSSHAFSVLDAQALSIQYLSKAANAGLPLAMQSLGESYIEGKGVRQDKTVGADWLWRAALNRSAGAFNALDAYRVCVVPLEIRATIYNAKKVEAMREELREELGNGLCEPCGPNLGSILVALRKPLRQMGFVLPPFAADVPGGTQRTGLVPIIGSTQLQEASRMFDEMEERSRGGKIEGAYGRRGTSAAATQGSLGHATRPLDPQRFVSPPAPTVAEVPSKLDVTKWAQSAVAHGIRVECIHQEQPMLTKPQHRPLVQAIACTECLAAACVRLEATARHAVLLSIDEALPGRGKMALYHDGDHVVSETYKDYTRGEVEVVLGALAAMSDMPALAHPIFIAADPNLFWPCIFYHGSVRAALAHVAPHENWTVRLGEANAPLPPEPVHQAVTDDPEVVLSRCGADGCINLQAASEKKFAQCNRCRRRLYCSRACQKADWVLHKHECAEVTSSHNSEVSALPDVTDKAGEDAFRGPSCGEEMIIFGLKSKPEYNGCLGRIIGEPTEEGRYPMDVRPPKATWVQWAIGHESSCRSLAVRACNLHRLGVSVIERGSSRKFVCSAHHREGSCETCCTDCSLANHLSKLRKSSVGAQSRVSHDLCQRVANNHFAAGRREKGKTGEMNQLEKDVILDLQGVPAGDRRDALKAALELSDPTLAVVAARACMVSFGASKLFVVEHTAVSHLEMLVNM